MFSGAYLSQRQIKAYACIHVSSHICMYIHYVSQIKTNNLELAILVYLVSRVSETYLIDLGEIAFQVYLLVIFLIKAN